MSRQKQSPAIGGGFPIVGENAMCRVRELVDVLVREATSPHAALTFAYEQLLPLGPELTDDGHTLRLKRTTHRKEIGSFYTPPSVAGIVVEEALGSLEGAPPLVLDPAMGTGAFLLAAAERLTSGEDRAAVVERCLYGVDRDLLAVQLAISALWLETGARPEVLTRHLRHGDLIMEEIEGFPDRFDLVVGNPPWGAAYPPAQRALLARRGSGCAGAAFDSFKLFLDLGSRLTRGAVGMIVPQAVLAQSGHAGIRQILMERLDPYAALDLSDHPFPGVAAPACALVFGPRPGPDHIRCRRLLSSGEVTETLAPRSSWSPETGFVLCDQRLVSLLTRLQAQHGTLGDLSHAFRVRDTGINYNRASVGRRSLYRGPTPDHPGDMPRFRGRNFTRYSTVGRGGWLRHDALTSLGPGESLSLDWSTYRRPEKIVLRQTADRLIATIDRSRMAMGRSVIAILAEDGASLRALLACLNSRLLTVLYRALSGEEGRVLPQVKVGRLRALPLPAVAATPVVADLLSQAEMLVPALLDSGDGADAILDRMRNHPLLAWACLERLAARRLRENGQAPEIENLIDQIVFRYYGLTDEEMALVTSVEGPDDLPSSRLPE